MVDFHCHILPGIDDGSKDIRSTRQLLEMLTQQDVTAVVATPHFYAELDQPEDFLSRRAAALEQVALLEGNFPPIIAGTEVAYFDGISHSGILNELQLGDSGLLLIEMPFCAWTGRMVQEICEIPSLTGLTPVLAHVNRYPHGDQFPGTMQHFRESGVLFQCNAEAFLLMGARRWAFHLLDEGYIHFLGSDAHDPALRPPKLDRATRIIAKKMGTSVLEDITAFSEEMLKI